MMNTAPNLDTDVDHKFWLIFEQAAVGIALLSPKGGYLRANPKLCKMLGYTEAQLCSLGFRDATYQDDVPASDELQNKLLAGEISTYRVEKRYMRRDRRIVWGHLSVSLVRDEAGVPMHFICVIQDITDRKQAQPELEQVKRRYQETLMEKEVAKIKRHATQDPVNRDDLTGLRSRRASDNVLNGLLMSKRAASFPFGVLVVDVDRFKTYNDIYGRLLGDEVLRQVALVLQNTCRVEDSAARYNGDAFLIVLPNTNPAGTIIVGEKLVRNVRAIDWSDTALRDEVTVSIGATCVSATGLTLPGLMGVLDQQLQQAKESGRNRLIMNTRQTVQTMGG